MGIIKGAIDFVTKEVILEVTDKAIKGIDKASEIAQKQDDKRKNKFIETNPEHCHIFISQIRHKLKETYYIYDSDQQIRYTVKGELLSMKHHLHLYDASGKKELATVKEKIIAVRSPLSMETNPKDFVIEIDGKKIGKIKTKGAILKREFDVTFNDWTVEGDVFNKNYKIIDSEKTL